jgi:hypothetical protein
MRFFLISCLFCLGSLMTSLSFQDEVISPPSYWISFSINEGWGLMQVDALGKVLRAPTVVVPGDMFGPGFKIGSAIAKGPNNDILMWLLGGQQSPLGGNIRIFNAVIDKQTVSTKFAGKTKFTSDHLFFIHVSQKKKNNFLVIQRESNQGPLLIAYDINRTGQFEGTRHRLSSMNLGFESCGLAGVIVCGGGISADGKMAHIIHRPSVFKSQLFTQRLDSEGKPVNDPQLIADFDSPSGTEAGIWAVDITNKLAGGKRFLVYLWSPQNGFSTQSNYLYMQQIDTKTGEKIGDTVLLYKYKYMGGVALDPDGKFVMFTIENLDKRFHGKSGLVFLPLDSNGNRTGRAKLIGRNAYGHIDILKD